MALQAFSRVRNDKRLLVSAAVLAVVVLSVAVVWAQATRPNFKFEAENGSGLSNATATSDSQASGGSYLAFSSGTGTGEHQFIETFDTDQSGRFDWRLQTTQEPPQRDFLGDHDRSVPCGSPLTYRTIHQVPLQWGVRHTNVDVSSSEMVWWCAPGSDSAKGHMMTGLDTDSVATLSFSPKQVFNNVKKVCWDQNMNNLGEGKWVNIFVVQNSDVVAHNGDLAYAATSGEEGAGTEAVPLKLPAGAFDFSWLRGSMMVYQHFGGTSTSQSHYYWESSDKGMDDGLPGRAASAPRYKICIDDAANTISIQRPGDDELGTQTETFPMNQAFPQGQVRVIFQDASYNPTKHNGSETALTWHWDNIIVD